MKRNRKKAIIFLLMTIIIILLAALACVALLIGKKKIKINNSFVSPDGIIGVDISHYQGDVDMDKLIGQGVKFVYAKATEGSGSVDEYFEKNRENGLKSGMPMGFYHFFSFDSPGKNQAENFIKTVGNEPGRLIPVVDVEFYGDKETNPPEKEDVERELSGLLRELEREYGYKPMLYTTLKVYFKYIKGTYDDYPLWIRNVYFPAKYVVGDTWTMWQYDDTAMLDGINGDEKYIDMDIINKEKGWDSIFML